MDSYGPNDWRSYLAHSLELKHSWGKKPEQKAKEKAYNHEYWEKNKERIMAQRKKHGDSNYSGHSRVKGEEGTEYAGKDFVNISDEEGILLDLMKQNEAMGGYDAAAMENIKQHNQNILKNITLLSEKVSDYLADHPDFTEAQREEVFKSFQDQVNKAMDMAIDLRKDSSKGYLNDIGIKPNGSSGKKSSGGSGSGSGSGGSGGGSSKSSDSASNGRGSKVKRDPTSVREHYTADANVKKSPNALSAQAKAYNQEHSADERRKPRHAR